MSQPTLLSSTPLLATSTAFPAQSQTSLPQPLPRVGDLAEAADLRAVVSVAAGEAAGKMSSKILILLIPVLLLISLFVLISKKPQPASDTVKSPSPQLQTSPSQAPSALKEQPPKTVIAQNLEIPWALAFLPNNSLVFTERPGRVRLIDKNGNLQKDPIYTVSQVKAEGEGGLLGIALDPQYNSNHFLYLYYTYDAQKTLNRVARYFYDDKNFKEDKIIVDAIPGAVNHNGGRLKFGPDGFLYITTGDSLNPSLAQDKNSMAGKILRVNTRGEPIPENPFGNRTYSYGHRNPQGIAWDKFGHLWETEHGNTATDELNFIIPGQNYGWPDIRGDQTSGDTISPLANSSNDTWAPSGMAYLNGYLYYAGLRSQALFRADIRTQENDLKDQSPQKTKELRSKVKITPFFKNELGRIREVVLGPDNMLYITTNNRDGRGTPKEGDDKIIKINPQKL